MDLLGAVVQLIIIVMFWGCVLGAGLLIWLFRRLKNRGGNSVHGTSAGTGQPQGSTASGRRKGTPPSAGTEPSSRTAAGSREGKNPDEQRTSPTSSSHRYRIDPAKQARYDKAMRETLFGPDEHNPRLDEMLGRKPSKTSAEPKHTASTRNSSPVSREERQRLRANEAESKERVRSALRALSEKRDPEGWSVYYVFDEIATDSAGMAEQVAVGPWGVCIVLVYDLPEGRVTLDLHTDRYRLNGEYFEEDPAERGCALVADVRPHIFGEEGSVFYLVCFTSVGEGCVEREDYPGASCSVWGLAASLVGGESVYSERLFSREEVDELARRVRETYNREPYIQPTRRIIEEADASEDSEEDPPR